MPKDTKFYKRKGAAGSGGKKSRPQKPKRVTDEGYMITRNGKDAYRIIPDANESNKVEVVIGKSKILTFLEKKNRVTFFPDSIEDDGTKTIDFLLETHKDTCYHIDTDVITTEEEYKMIEEGLRKDRDAGLMKPEKNKSYFFLIVTKNEAGELLFIADEYKMSVDL